MENDSWVERSVGALRPPQDWSPDGVKRLAQWRERIARSRARQRQWKWALSAATAAAALLLSLPAGRAIAQRCVGACVAGATRAGSFLWPAASLAPDFTLDDAEGRPVRLSDFRGRVVLLNFWATWCPPCLVEIPWFAEFQHRYEGAGLTVLGVSLDEDGWTAVRPFLKTHAPGYRMMAGGNAVAQLYGGVDTLPATILIDRDGRIVASHTGLVSKSVYEAEIRSLLTRK